MNKCVEFETVKLETICLDQTKHVPIIDNTHNFLSQKRVQCKDNAAI